MRRARHTYLTNHTALQTCEVSARVWADERLCLWASLRMIMGRYMYTRWAEWTQARRATKPSGSDAGGRAHRGGAHCRPGQAPAMSPLSAPLVRAGAAAPALGEPLLMRMRHACAPCAFSLGRV